MTDKPNLEFFKDKAGEYRWRIRAGNHQIVGASQGYTRKRDAERGFQDLHRIIWAMGPPDEEPSGDG